MSQPIKIMAFIETGPTQQQIRTALSSNEEFQLVADEQDAEKATHKVHDATPDIIVIDHQIDGESTLDLVDELALQFPEIPIVALLGEEDNLKAQQYLLAGVRAFMIKPFTQINLLSTLRRIRELEGRRRVAQPVAGGNSTESTEPLQILTVYSPRGGVGCSTLSINLAVALHEQFEARVLLMEGKMIFGHLGLMLNFRPQNSIADLIPHAGALENTLVEEVVSQHASGIHVLLSPSDLNVAQGIRPDDLYNVIKAVSRIYDVIVIDAGSYLGDNTVTLMDASDRVLLITTPDLAALHDTSRFIQLTDTLGFPPDKVLTVLNRAGMQGGVKIREIENALQQKLFAQISEGNEKVIQSLNRGVPLVFSSPRNKMSKEIRSLALQLSAMRPGAELRPMKKSKFKVQLKRNGNGKPAHVQQHKSALRMLGR
jgi:pilus assembly protein CpaE